MVADDHGRPSLLYRAPHRWIERHPPDLTPPRMHRRLAPSDHSSASPSRALSLAISAYFSMRPPGPEMLSSRTFSRTTCCKSSGTMNQVALRRDCGLPNQGRHRHSSEFRSYPRLPSSGAQPTIPRSPVVDHFDRTNRSLRGTHCLRFNVSHFTLQSHHASVAHVLAISSCKTYRHYIELPTLLNSAASSPSSA